MKNAGCRGASKEALVELKKLVARLSGGPTIREWRLDHHLVVRPLGDDRAVSDQVSEHNMLCRAYRVLLEQLEEVDDVLAEYGIDTVGTGSAPSKKEQARVDSIVGAASDRFEARHDFVAR